jgi:hypothetical protein
VPDESARRTDAVQDLERVVSGQRGEIDRLGLREGQKITLRCAVNDGQERRVSGLTVTPYDLPPGAIAGYYPELNPLVPLSYHEKNSQTPAYKGTPVEVIA